MQLERITVTFTAEGMEISTTYSHRDEPRAPGSKKRTLAAARMARAGLKRAIEGLDADGVVWGGFRTNTQVSTDTVILDRRESAA